MEMNSLPICSHCLSALPCVRVLFGAVWCCVVLCGSLWCYVVLCGATIQEPRSVEKIMEVDSHIGAAMSGLTADARTLIHHGRIQTQATHLGGGNRRGVTRRGHTSVACRGVSWCLSVCRGASWCVVACRVRVFPPVYPSLLSTRHLSRGTTWIHQARSFDTMPRPLALAPVPLPFIGLPSLHLPTPCTLAHSRYHTDPSGTFVRYDAKAIGAGTEGAQANLQDSYNK
ncbi:unnamed protein product, partial [Closterium sp. NIES-54]